MILAEQTVVSMGRRPYVVARAPTPSPAEPARPPHPPFNAPAARRLRSALSMGPEHVAYGMRVSYGLPYVTPDLVIAWERGAASPTSPELTALAGVLWCSPGELIGRPRTLREHRIARGLAPEDVARAVGLELLAYLRMEEQEEWRGTDRQSAALAELLGLSLPDFVTVTGREDKLGEHLRERGHHPLAGVRPSGREDRAPGPAPGGGHPPGRCTASTRGRWSSTLSWGGGDSDAPTTPAVEFLDRIVERFWATVRNNTSVADATAGPSKRRV